jgi:hypothetical protein
MAYKLIPIQKNVWKFSNVVPIIPKVNSDYRPIFILSVITKAFENVMFEQMADCVTRNILITSFQSGFQPGHSTND